METSTHTSVPNKNNQVSSPPEGHGTSSGGQTLFGKIPSAWAGVLIVALLALGGAYAWFTQLHEKTEEAARVLFSQALDAYDRETAALKKTLLDERKKKDPKAVVSDVEVATMAVDFSNSPFEGSIKLLREIPREHPRTRAAFEARVLLAKIYIEHRAPQIAINLILMAIEEALNRYDKAWALSVHALAYEAGDSPASYETGLESVERGLKLGEPMLEEELMMTKARLLTKLGKKEEAKKVYDEVSAKFSTSPVAQVAQAMKARL